MAQADPRLEPAVWGADQEKDIVIGNAVLPLFDRERKGIVSTLRYGDRAVLYAQDGEWSLVAGVHDRYLGWAEELRITAMRERPARVRNLATHIYSKANMKEPPIGRLSLGSCVTPLDQDGDFTQTEMGYIFSKHLEPVGDVVDYAIQCLDIPYLWGGGSDDGIDCSGLTQLCYSMVGIEIPRDTDQQEAALAKVKWDARERGDLIYWPGHVGILEDADTLIHATAFAMKTIREDLGMAIKRIGKPSSVRRVG